MEKLRPQLFSTLKGYTAAQFGRDAVAGVIVAIIALPLSIALALASGVGPEIGLYTAIAAGFIISLLGGSRVQIAGPTAAFATIVAGIVAKSGMTGLIVATLMAGLILIIMGLLRFGSLIKYIPATITTGFTSGIAITIAIGQLKDFFGLTVQGAPVETMEKLSGAAAAFGTVNLWALLVGAVSLAILILWPKVSKRIPGSLIAVLVSIGMVQLFKLPVNTIGSLYTLSSALPTVSLPAFDFVLIRDMLPDALTIALLAGIESLLSCVVSDGMIGARHNPNMELIAQGAGNIASALFGGIPATGAIARTAANVKNGGRTPVSGMVHAVVLLLILVALMPYAALIPMPAIAAILLMVAYNMSEWRRFAKLVKTAPKSDIAVLVITFLLTVIFDLVIAIEVGMLMSMLLLMKRMAQVADVRSWTIDEAAMSEDEHLRPVPEGTLVYELEGSLFFAAADKLLAITTEAHTRALVLRMRGVSAMDATAMQSMQKLLDTCKAQGVTMILSHVMPQPMEVMHKAGFDEALGEENLCPNIDAALERARLLAS
ncbi:MAG: SulP family inorganic anion transporter [Eubacteriales bacterium]|nr:SulP family inorganic anion transporter [Eubacteriales bacterium]